MLAEALGGTVGEAADERWSLGDRDPGLHGPSPRTVATEDATSRVLRGRLLQGDTARRFGRTWSERTDLIRFSRRFRLIVVMPDGGHGPEAGWYSDWADGSRQWETFHTEVLVDFVDRAFNTLGDGGAAVVAEKIREGIGREPVADGGGPIRVTVSIGVAGYPEDASDPDGLIRAADAALYRAKRSGRDRVALAAAWARATEGA